MTIMKKDLIAQAYHGRIKNKLIKQPSIIKNTKPVWHQYVIQCHARDQLQHHLLAHGISTDIHYPIPPHQQPSFSYLKPSNLPITESLSQHILSLPCSPTIDVSMATHISNIINEF